MFTTSSLYLSTTTLTKISPPAGRCKKILDFCNKINYILYLVELPELSASYGGERRMTENTITCTDFYSLEENIIRNFTANNKLGTFVSNKNLMSRWRAVSLSLV